MPQTEPVLEYARPSTPPGVRVSQLLYAALTGAGLGFLFGNVSFHDMLSALVVSPAVGVASMSTNDVRDACFSYSAINACAGAVIAVAGLIWDRRARWGGQLIVTLILFAIYAGTLAATARTLRVSALPPIGMPLPPALAIQPQFIPVSQLPVRWPPLVALAVVLCLSLLGMGLRDRARSGRPSGDGTRSRPAM